MKQLESVRRAHRHLAPLPQEKDRYHCTTLRDGAVFQGSGSTLKEALAALAKVLPAKKRNRKKS